MSFDMNGFLNVLGWTLPVVLGAIIGYVTNAIAIRMLFRPLKEKRILGVRVPFTPGIIPKQRYKFSTSIGRMVSDELITEEAIKKQISKESFKRGVYSTISNITESLLTNPGEFIGKERIDSLMDSMEVSISTLLYTFFNSRFFIHMTRGLVEKLIDSVLNSEVASVVEIFEKNLGLKNHLGKWVEKALDSEIVKKNVVGWIKKLLLNHKEGEVAFLIPGLFDILGEVLKNFLPSIYEHFFLWLRSEDTHKVLEINGRFLLRDILDRLTPVQKLIVSAGQFDRSLDEKMPEIIDEVLSYLENFLYKSETVEKIGDSVSSGLKKWYRENGALLSDISSEKVREIENLISDLYDLSVKKLKSSNLSTELVAWLDNWVERHGETRFYDLLIRNWKIDISSLVDLISSVVLDITTKKETALTISREIVNHLEFLFRDSGRGDLKSYLNITEEKKRKLDSFITGEILRLLNTRVIELIESLDVHTLVVEKIDGLDVESVESLLLKVIAEHLKWINIFGAILGALIGLTQLLLRFIK